jgi:two-component system nitrate/nitrite response regulator NarL
MPPASTGQILVVDDDDEFRSFAVDLLQHAGYGTRELTTGDAVLPTVAAEHPAVVVLDVNLPRLNGYEVCHELRDSYGEGLPIVFVSGERTEAFDRAAGLLVGADEYLVKPIDPGELIARIRRLLERPWSERESAHAKRRFASLTPREQEILDLLSSGRRQEEIARALVISPNTVATHIQRILTKLGVHSRAQAVAIALDKDRDVSGHGLA